MLLTNWMSHVCWAVLYGCVSRHFRHFFALHAVYSHSTVCSMIVNIILSIVVWYFHTKYEYYERKVFTNYFRLPINNVWRSNMAQKVDSYAFFSEEHIAFFIRRIMVFKNSILKILSRANYDMLAGQRLIPQQYVWQGCFLQCVAIKEKRRSGVLWRCRIFKTCQYNFSEAMTHRQIWLKTGILLLQTLKGIQFRCCKTCVRY